MIDFISFNCHYSLMKWESLIEFIGIQPKECVNKVGIRSEQCIWGNLRLKYSLGSSQLTVSNSLHKFYNGFVGGSGEFENSDLFTFEHLRESIETLCVILDVAANECCLQGRFEFGVNITTSPFTPKQYIDSYIGYYHSTKPFRHVYKNVGNEGKKMEQVHCQLSQYTVKWYNKSIESKRAAPNLLRFEVCTHTKSKLRNILEVQNPTLETLTNRSTAERLKSVIMDVYHSIEKLPMEPEKTDFEDFKEILAYAHPIGKTMRKGQLSPWNFHKERNQIKRDLISSYDDPQNGHRRLLDQIEETLDAL